MTSHKRQCDCHQMAMGTRQGSREEHSRATLLVTSAAPKALVLPLRL